MKRYLWAGLSVCLVGCSSADNGDSKPSSCDPNRRAGTYLMTATTRSGDCGKLESSLVVLDPAETGAADGCTVRSERFSEGACALERTVTCVSGKLKTEAVGISRQVTADGSRLEGILTVVLTGESYCRGTYDVVYVRQ